MMIEKWIRLENKGQATLELTVSLIFVMLFLVGSIKIFLWLNESMVNRQVDYEANRSYAASRPFTQVDIPDVVQTDEAGLAIPGEVLVDESDKARYPDLNIFESKW